MRPTEADGKVFPTVDPNRGRWPEHPTWAALREGFGKLAMHGVPALPEDARELVRASRYSGYRRLLDRMAAGILTTVEAMDTDSGAALATWVAYMARLAGRIRRQQKLRQRIWQREQASKRGPQGQSLVLGIAPDLHRGMGARLDCAAKMEKRELLLHMALGAFDAAGVVRLSLHREADVARVSDLLLYSLDELERIAAEKGGIRRLLDEKWRRVYRANTPRGLFTRSETTAA